MMLLNVRAVRQWNRGGQWEPALAGGRDLVEAYSPSIWAPVPPLSNRRRIARPVVKEWPRRIEGSRSAGPAGLVSLLHEPDVQMNRPAWGTARMRRGLPPSIRAWHRIGGIQTGAARRASAMACWSGANVVVKQRHRGSSWVSSGAPLLPRLCPACSPFAGCPGLAQTELQQVYYIKTVPFCLCVASSVSRVSCKCRVANTGTAFCRIVPITIRGSSNQYVARPSLTIEAAFSIDS